MSVGDILKFLGILLAIVAVAIAIAVPIALIGDAKTLDKGERISLLEDDVALLQEAVDCLLNYQDWEEIACIERADVSP